MWMNLRAGLSREAANTLLRGLRLIIWTVISLVFNAFQSSAVGLNINISPLQPQLPTDIRSAYSHGGFDAVIEQTVCCPTCFSLFCRPFPERCYWKQTPRAWKCDTPLWKTQNTSRGTKEVPVCVYVTQKFDVWLEFFLGRKDIEDALIRTHAHTPPAPGETMSDVFDSPAWANLRSYRRSPYHLVFGLYIDWFNPYTNKIAGKVISCGAIVLYCLSLPPEIRYLPENVFIVGLTPPPKAPDFVTISHILDPHIDDILRYEPSRPVKTHYHPAGVSAGTRVVPLIADLQASRKTSGSLGHAAIQFCWFCKCEGDHVEELDSSLWMLRSGFEVRQLAELWKRANTKTRRAELATKNGIRWTPLHRLPYWDPVLHVILGFMHNWLEGVLQHQLRTLWGIGRNAARKKQAAENNADEELTEQSMVETADELDDLRLEAQQYERNASRQQDTAMDVDDPPATPSTAFTGSPSPPSTPRAAPAPNPGPSRLRRPQLLDAIRNCIRTVSMPTWLHRPPGNLGEASHGKLKAADYLTLFTVILPLILPELWTDPPIDPEERMAERSTTLAEHLDSFYNLSAATFIVTDFKTSDADADTFTAQYIAYRTSMKQLFPTVSSVPNHHYAMHNGALMKYWGPLPVLSEFPGERLNGIFQKVKTNKHMSDISLTMMQQTTRRARIQVALAKGSKDLRDVADMLSPTPGITTTHPQPIGTFEEAVMMAKAPALDQHTYKLILAHLNACGRPYRHYKDTPHPEYNDVLPPAGETLHHVTVGDRTWSRQSAHNGNSAIEFVRPPYWIGASTGFIQEIWRIPLSGMVETFFVVRPHNLLRGPDLERTPYHLRPLFRVDVAEPRLQGPAMILESRHIRSHVATWTRPAGTYDGIDREVLLISRGLNRRRG
ncbi:hypothetical protein CYLTODRAFT_477169 [Cylindrobasidium torrendii FP15055 ss-10]|uniref:Uncharacterized protein n=1 Tax=Cylindrobasidium torrendii FP15055 ss-10 TaxID=1314674 RepID=A0A0D7AUP0_9AGAR|nr:hypothetical protein CYLTODRAFT_477169 [Cylindrobasidium torrendii FP15055 ss-10]